jgi:bacterioferritin
MTKTVEGIKMKYSEMITALITNGMDILPTLLVRDEQQEDAQEEDEGLDPTSALLQLALVGEYQQWDLYTAYASRLKGAEREPIADHFKEHAGDELGHIELLQRYLVSLGENPTLQRKPLPEMAEDATIEEIVKLQLQYEQDAVNLYKKILNFLPDNEPLKLDIESIITKEQEHVHDLELLLLNKSILAKTMVGANAKNAAKNLLDGYFDDKEANTVKGKKNKITACQTFRPMEHGEPTKPQAGYGQDCDCNCGQSFLQKVAQEWCTMALKELTPDIYARWHQGKLLTAQEKAFVVQAIALKWGLKDKRAMLRFLDSCKA